MSLMSSVVSIILPTYNRANFLPAAFESIVNQDHTDWQLIIIDDGSTDDTEFVVKKFAASIHQPVIYQWQPNAGAGAARNAAIPHVSGDFVAFFDSDDCWLPHHLTDCCTALQMNPEIDWVFGGAEVVDLASGRTIIENTMHGPDGDRPCLKLKTICVDNLNIIEDKKEKLCAIEHGHFAGLQASVMRRRVVESIPYPTDRIADDTVFGMRITANGFRAAYFDRVHIRRFLHDDHVSLVHGSNDFEKSLTTTKQYLFAMEKLNDLENLTGKERRALNKHLAAIRFWQLGYSTYWMNGHFEEAIESFKNGLKLTPFDLRKLKTYSLSVLKYYFRGSQ